MKIEDIEGIGAKYARKLRSAGVRTTEGLLKTGATAAGRAALAAATELTEKQVLEWVNRADLYRIKGVGSEYADLLEAAGVDTVVELARRDTSNFFEKLKTTNAEKKKVRHLPNAEQVGKWIAQAKSLPRVIKY